MLTAVLIASTAAMGTTQGGGNGLIYTQSARTIEKGHLQLFTGTAFYGKIVGFVSRPYTLWNVQGAASLNLGLGPNLELGISPILYQDTNKGGGNVLGGAGNMPDDLFIHLKIGNLAGFESPFIFGGQISTRIPTASSHNIIYEPYSAGSLGVGVTGLASYFSNAVFLDEGWSLHANLRLWYHNDLGQNLVPDNESETSAYPLEVTTELMAMLGARFPAGNFDFSAELHSRYFIARPPASAYSRENVAYLTGGVYYKPNDWITFQMGVDVLLYSGEDITEYNPLPAPPADFPNYPPWKGLLGARISILPLSLYKPKDKSIFQRRSVEQRELLERTLSGEATGEKGETELERIRAAREKLEADLKRIRELLEEETKKKEKKKEGGGGGGGNG